MLFIGSSHVRRLGTFATGRTTPRRYKKLLENSKFLGIGGAKWWTLHNNLDGQELPRGKRHLGNMWEQYQNSMYHPHFVVCLGGGNDTEDLDLFLKHHLATKTSQYDKRLFARSTMTTWYNDLTPEIDQFFEKLQKQVPGCEMKYISIFERPWWGFHARKFAHWLNHYVLGVLGRHYRIKELKVPLLFRYQRRIEHRKMPRDDILPGLLELDDVHLSSWGMRALTTSAMSPLLHKWFAEKCHARMLDVGDTIN